MGDGPVIEGPVLEGPGVQGTGVAVPAYSHRQIMLIMSGLLMGLLLSSLDQTIVSTALTTISRDFHRVDLYSWVVTAYLLTSTACTPLYGKISDQFGRKRVFQVAIVIFLAGSALSGMSQNMYQLIVFRGVQGIGAGGLMVLAFAIVGDIIPARERGRYQGYFGATFAVSSVIGPLVGGFLVDQASWRWVFYVNLPIGIVALFVINRVLKVDHRSVRSRIDSVGSVLIVSGVSLFLVGVQLAGNAAKVTTLSLVYALSGVVLVVAFALWERRAKEPIIPLRLFHDRVFTVANILAFITGTVMFGALIFIPLYLQAVRHVSPTVSGLRMLPMLAGVLLTSITSGRMVSKYGRYKIFVIVGTAVLTLGMLWMTTISLTTTVWTLAAMMFTVGAGLGLFMQTLVLAVQNSVPFEDMGSGTATVTFFRTLGGAIGAAVLGAVLLMVERRALPHYLAVYHDPALAAAHAFVHGLDMAFTWAVPVGFVSFGLSFLLREVNLRETVGGGESMSESMMG
jgi:EmrB/QacA subfamily drug resistance transporter